MNTISHETKVWSFLARLFVLLALLAGGLVLSGSGFSRAYAGPQGPLPNFTAEGDHLIRLLAGAFDPLAGSLPAGSGLPLVEAAALPAGTPQYWLVQVADRRYADTTAAIEGAGALMAGSVPDDTYMVRATPAQAEAIAGSSAVRWVGYYQPAWRVPIAAGGKAGLLDLAGTQIYRVHVFRADPDPSAVGQALAAMAGVVVVEDAGVAIDIRATAAQVPAIAALPAVEWIGIKPEIVLHNVDSRWVNDTGVRDVYEATAPGRLTGAGQTAAVADTGINYTYDLNGRAHVAFRDCDAGGANCKTAIYTQAQPGTATANMTNVVDNNTGHRKVVAYFDLGSTGPNPFDTSSHGSHTGGSVTGDQGNNGVWDGEDGIAPGAMHVHQNIGSSSGGLALPSDDYQLWRQAYRPRNPNSVSTNSSANGNVADHANYRPLEDARTHNNSYGLIAPVIDEGSAVALDKFVWDHEDMVIVVSAGNGGPDIFSIGSPSVAKNNLSSGASANGRQPMASIDSMASFSSHGPTADGRFGPDLATPGQIVVSVKGGTEDGYHVAQGTSMSGPILTGLATLVRQYFYDGYGPAGGSGFPGGEANPARSHNPSAALVKATMINGAVRMRGYYTGDDGSVRAQDGQWPSAGQGFGLVNLANSLYFAGDPLNNWYHDVWRSSSQAFRVSGTTPVVRTYTLAVAGGAPLDVTLSWTDAPDLLPAGTPALVNNLDLEVVAPDGTVYVGNNMNSRLVPLVDVAETLPGPGARDETNLTERVRIASPAAGTWTIRVIGDRIRQANQGFALAASGTIALAGQTFTPGPALQVDAAGSPTISAIAVEPISGDTARVTFTTSEPTTAVVEAGGVTFVDSYNAGPSGFNGLNAGTVETSAAYANRPVVGTAHEVLLTGLTPGQAYPLAIEVTDLGGNTTAASVDYTSPATVFQPDAPDIGQLIQGSTSTNQWRTGTQLYAGTNAGNGILGAFMFRIPEGALDPADITGAYVEMTSAHDWMIRYTQDPQLYVDLLDESVETTWGTQTYDMIHDAAADARVYPESAHLRGAGYDYAFTFNCADLQALRDTLTSVSSGERLAAFRYESTPVSGTGLFAMDFGFNRRSNGPAYRPRLVLYTGGETNPLGAPCDPGTPAPTISKVGVYYDGLHGSGPVDDAVTVSWETDVAANSLVLFREQGTSTWTQVGTPALTRVHHVQVFGLDSSKQYEFAVRSAACNGATTTDANGGEGYAFFYPPPPPPPQTDDFWFHGLPDDQISKAAGPPFNNSFNQSAPTLTDTATQQTTTPLANDDFVGNPLAAFWVGAYSGTIDGEVELRWHWSTENATAIAFGSQVDVTFFADPNFNASSAVQPEKIIGRGSTRLTFDAAGVPTLNISRIPVNGTVRNQLLIQVVSSFLDTGEGLVVHYNNQLLDSGFGIPQTSADPQPTIPLPRTGPATPLSAGATGLVVPPTRTGPAAAADIAAGTGLCAIAEPGVNNDPIAVDDSATVNRGGSVTIDVLANDSDPDGDTISVASFTQPSSGTVTENPNGSLTYMHDGSTSTADSFTYTIEDGRGGSDSATVSITITDTPPPPNDATKTTGGGWLAATDGKKINFGFNAKQESAGFSGNLQLNDKGTDVKIHLTDVTTLGAVNGSCGGISAGPNALEFSGTGTYNGSAAAFRVCVEDNGEPGKDSDRFVLMCTAGCGYSTSGRTADAVIDGGNLQVHQAAGSGSGGGGSTSGGGSSANGQASTLVLNPLLLSEGVIGQLQLFTVLAYDAGQNPMSGAQVTLTRVTAAGTESFTAVTDLTGQAFFTLVNLSQAAETIAVSGNVQSNAVSVKPLLP